MTNLGTNFYPKLVQVSSALGMKPEDLLAVMVSESGLDPSAHEQKYNGGGLVGFMPDTLKGLKFPGSPEDFRKLSGEQQLDWVKKLVQGFMPLNGGPFTSAAQYYVANFFPVALKLPGIRQGRADTIFIEENPQVITDPVSGRAYSKKYYDIGIKISPRLERAAYKDNPLFHGSVQGAITYGDMMRQVAKNRKNPLYNKAVIAMENTTGYQPSTPSQEKSPSYLSGFLAKLEHLLHQFVMASEDKHNFLITVGSSSDRYATMEYARILSAALQDYLQADVQICADDSNIEIECKVHGNKNILFDAMKELSIGVTDAFKYATRDLGSITSFALVTCDVKSDYKLLHPKKADLYARVFKLKFVREK